jgi:hypothetical protein
MLTVDDLANLIRMADPGHNAGAGEMAEKMLPWIIAAMRNAVLEEAVRAVEEAHARNVSGENWMSRAVNCIRSLKGNQA